MLLNLVAFQAGWFACVLGAAHGWAWAGTLFAAAIVAGHVAMAVHPRSEAIVVALAVALGLACDSALAATRVVSFASPWPSAYAAPLWILAMWALFATTLNLSMRWLRGRWALGTLLGFLMGPLAYAGGARLGALELANPAVALTALALIWGAVVPAMVEAARRVEGNRRAAT